MAVLQDQLEDPSLIPTEEHTRRQLLKLLLLGQKQHSFPQEVSVPDVVYSPGEQPTGEEEGGVGLPLGLRMDREMRRSGVIMSATVGHGGERVGSIEWWSPV